MGVRGLSVLELALSLGLLGAISTVIYCLIQITMGAKKYSDSSQILAILNAHEHILRITRASTFCQKEIPLQPPIPDCGVALSCGIDLGVPPTGVLSEVRFVPCPDQILYYQQRLGTWQTQSRFDQVGGLLLCDSADMLSGICPLLPTTLNLTTSTSKYFRYKLTAPPTSNERAFGLQSGFYVANPLAVEGVYLLPRPNE